MKLTHTILYISILSVFAPAYSQSIDTANTQVWVDLMQDPNANFFEIQRASNVYWEGREHERGDGWKVFKRYENYWRDRINPDGSFPSAESTKDAYEQWRIAYNQNQSGMESDGGDWVNLGPFDKPDNGTGQPNGNGRLNTICFHPTDSNTMWVGAPAGGLWKTTNGGVSWSSNTDNMPTLGVSSILIDPTNTSVMYMGTGDRDAWDAPGLGVYKSTDGGASWGVSNTGMGNRIVGAMIMHPSNSSYILAATSGGVYRTTNGGSNWTLETSSYYFKDIQFKPGDPNTVYATETSSGANFWKSTDGGNSWSVITSGLPTNGQRFAIGVSPDNANTVYILCSISSAYGGLFKSTNSGTSFSTQSTSPNILSYNESPPTTGGGGQGWYDLAIAVDPTDESVVYVGGVNVFKSINNGSTWDCVAHWVGSSTAASVHADQHFLKYSPVTNNLFGCNDGGLYYTSNEGQTWPEISDSLAISQLYRIGVSQQTNELVINGYQDNGTALYDDTIFRTERGGDGMECIIDYTDDNVMYMSIYYGNIARSFNNGYSLGSFAGQNINSITESGAWITPFILDNEDPNTMFIGYKNVWRTSNATASSPTFEAISSNLAGSNGYNIRDLKQSKVNMNRLWMIRSDNRLFRSNNALAGTVTWTDLSPNLPGSGTVQDIETHPTSNSTIWLLRNSTVYMSVNSGITWISANGTLPNVYKSSLLADPYSEDGIYVATDAGVYYIDDNLSNWIAFDDGLPVNVEITELELYHEQGNWEGGRIRAATYGRGLWESDRYDPGSNPPLPFFSLSIDTTDICSFDTISILNNTAYGMDSVLWEFTPSSGITFVNGTDSNSLNPQFVVSELGSYDILLKVYNSNGSDSLLVTDAISMSGGIIPQWTDDFESNVGCGTAGCVTDCDVLEWTNVTNGNGDDIDWRADAGGTPTSSTGPAVDYDPGTSTGIYLYLESSSCVSQEAILESPCFQLTNCTAPKVSFGYHRYGYAPWMESLAVDVLSNGSWTNLWTQTGTQSSSDTDWKSQVVNLSSYLNQNVKVRFRGLSGSGWQADQAIDGIELIASPLADFEASDSTPCLNTTITLSDSSSQNPTSWSWTITPSTYQYLGGSSSSSQHPQIMFTQPGSYSITLQASNANGGDFEVKSNYITVIDPVIDIESNSDSNRFCIDDTVIITATIGHAVYNFYWNAALAQTGSSNQYSTTAWADSDYVYVSIMDTNGCLDTSETLYLYSKPTAAGVVVSSDSDNVICEGDTVTMTVNGYQLTSYSFYQSGTPVQSGSGNSWTTSGLADEDEIWAELNNIHECPGLSDTLIITVNPIPPTPAIQLVLDSLGATIPGQLYEWSFNDSSTISGDSLYAKHGDGSYTVRIFVDGCWSEVSAPFVILGVEGLDDLKIKVYPSPTSDILNIKLSQSIPNEDAVVMFFNMAGQIVLTENISGRSGVSNFELDLSILPSGTYTMILQTGDRNIAVPIIKEKR